MKISYNPNLPEASPSKCEIRICIPVAKDRLLGRIIESSKSTLIAQFKQRNVTETKIDSQASQMLTLIRCIPMNRNGQATNEPIIQTSGSARAL